MTIHLENAAATHEFGRSIGVLAQGGEVIELVGDIGAGKTALTKGIARGMGIDEDVQSPTFTLSRVYEGARGLRLVHYDFYRLNDAGIMSAELDESVREPHTVTVVEWAGIVAGVLPEDRLTINFVSPTESTREVTLVAGGTKSQAILEGVTA